ncbi:hypothetical protein [Micromonospora sp. NBC_01796]|uniref:hypothetical protein n=1 Tax=Micromonospora sp. NBC_01796 TaxID=2975987 RepID=UPI002DDC3788|nr:hypothetical protein [Micromonospora sp. NBC_01796]WSA83601.1 hypothetical protein OIE47_24825 [Micromonospora sp. NBC_01796]
MDDFKRPTIAAAIALLPVSLVLVAANDGPLWAGIVGWAVGAAVIVVLGLGLGWLRSRTGSR